MFDLSVLTASLVAFTLVARFLKHIDRQSGGLTTHLVKTGTVVTERRGRERGRADGQPNIFSGFLVGSEYSVMSWQTLCVSIAH